MNSLEFKKELAQPTQRKLSYPACHMPSKYITPHTFKYSFHSNCRDEPFPSEPSKASPARGNALFFLYNAKCGKGGLC